MTESNLPTARENPLAKSYQTTNVENSKVLRTDRLLLVGGMIMSFGAIGLFLINQYLIFSIISAVMGILFFGARQLVKKSMFLTSTQSQTQLTSTEQELEHIRKQVSKCKFLENIENEGLRAANQADQLVQQFKNLKHILSQKFESSELTFSRYLNAIETSCLSIGENLIHTKNLLENLNLTKSDFSPLPPERIASLEQRDEPQIQVKHLLDSTDQALHGLALLFNSINEITTKERHKDQLEQSMQQIRELAERAKIYSKN